jgi:hypothetical protein
MAKSMASREPWILEIKQAFTSPRVKRALSASFDVPSESGAEAKVLESGADAKVLEPGADDDDGDDDGIGDGFDECAEGFVGGGESEAKVSDQELDDDDGDNDAAKDCTSKGRLVIDARLGIFGLLCLYCVLRSFRPSYLFHPQLLTRTKLISEHNTQR